MRKKRKPAKFADGGAVGSDLRNRIAAAREQMTAYAGQDRPIRRGPPIRPKFADTSLEGVKARLSAAGSTPGNKVSTTGNNGWLGGLFYGGTGDAYTPVSPPIPAPRTGGAMPAPTGSSTSTGESGFDGGNKKGGLIRKGGKTLRPSGKTKPKKK